MKKLAALLLALLLTLGCLTGLAEAVDRSSSTPGIRELRQETAGLQAKSRKKKNTATPRPEASPTPAAPAAAVTPTPVPEGPITDPQSIADYLFSHDMQLPENFLTKKEVQALGWQNGYRYVSDAAPGKSIGGDRFGNYEGQLPTGKGITYREADCNYVSGPRGAERVVFSTEGRVWYTGDHYVTFIELFPTDSEP